MSAGVLFKEQGSPSNPQAQAIMRNVEVNNDAQRPDSRGIVPDTLGFISRDSSVVRFLEQNQINATFSQAITVYGTVGREYRTALTLQNQYQLTNSGVTITTGV